MLPPFPTLIKSIGADRPKKPGAAEIVVYLLITSSKWHELVQEACKQSGEKAPHFDEQDWEAIGNWILGFEPEPHRAFLAEIISGPLDADKLDYIARDAYFSGIPIGHDYERYVSLVCLDYQANTWRLTLPSKGINALEQLIMARLALTSYLYHHQKVRAAEAWFERLLAREYRDNQSFFGKASIWELFSIEDAELYSRACTDPNSDWAALLHRRLPVRYVEFRKRDLLNVKTDAAGLGYMRLLDWTNEGDWELYKELLEFEDSLAKELRLNPGDVILDSPRSPSYADLNNLQLPGHAMDSGLLAMEALNYNDWIDAYKTHRAFVRIFAPRGTDSEAVFQVAGRALQGHSLTLGDISRVR